ncbi:MAG: glycosyltransferase family 1 protein [Deltaproteobacteria bacterium]|nr:glycosyltransferase family 1 protein [Deltaproteobacteria bacterium]
MRVLVIGSPKRDFHVGFDTLTLGLGRAGAEVDHYPNILTESYGHTGAYSLRFEGRDIAFPEYRSVADNLRKKRYDLIITTVCHVDYSGGKHGYLSWAARRFKFSLRSNRRKLGGTLVSDWLRQGMKLPPFIVVDDTDDPFIYPVDLDLLWGCAAYFKRELPFDKFFCFRLFESALDKEQKIALASKIQPVWISYDAGSIEPYVRTQEIRPYREREVDISFLCNIHMSYNRLRMLPILEGIGKSYRVATMKNGKFGKKEYFDILKNTKISISLEGRGWDCPKHYEMMLCGSLLFVARPTRKLAFDLKDGHNCVFVGNDLGNIEERLEYYLENTDLSAAIATRGHELARDSLNNVRLAEYVLGTAVRAIGENV